MNLKKFNYKTSKNFMLHCGFVLVLLSILQIVACSITPNANQTHQVLTQAQNQGFTHAIINTSTFKLTSYYKINNIGKPLTVYIEGDGHSWNANGVISNNPTPHKPLALQLALKDNNDNIAYLARPCQYTPIKQDKLCTNKYWFTHRFSPEVINANIEAIEFLKKQAKTDKLHLIGFSGGGGLAAILSAKLNPISLTTIAGDLDIEAMTKYHKTSNLHGSLNPIDFASSISHIKQKHFVGEKDKIVPVFVAEKYVAKVNSDNAKVIVLKKVGHHKGWVQKWPDLLEKL